MRILKLIRLCGCEATISSIRLALLDFILELVELVHCYFYYDHESTNQLNILQTQNKVSTIYRNRITQPVY